ncbi:MAG: hypothetical protein ACPGRF_06370 [Miltoncostaeaceae bacterium]
MSDHTEEVRRRNETRVYVEGMLMGALFTTFALPSLCVIIYTIWVTHAG